MRISLSGALAFLSVPAALFAIWLTMLGGSRGADSLTGAALFVLALATSAITIAAIGQEFRYGRKARYAEALDNVLAATRLSTDATLCVDDDADRVRAMLEATLNEIAEAFTLITGTRVSVCLKTVVPYPPTKNGGDGARPYVDDICRDRKSQRRGEQVRAHQSSQPAPVHYVDLNSDFKYLFENKSIPEKDYAMSGDLSRDMNFQTTSFQVYGQPHDGRLPVIGPSWRSLTWPLPYRSTLMLRLVTVAEQPLREMTFLGFLCMDSRSRHVFNDRHDLSLLRVFAEAIKPPLNSYLASLSRDRFVTPY